MKAALLILAVLAGTAVLVIVGLFSVLTSRNISDRSTESLTLPNGDVLTNEAYTTTTIDTSRVNKLFIQLKGSPTRELFREFDSNGKFLLNRQSIVSYPLTPPIVTIGDALFWRPSWLPNGMTVASNGWARWGMPDSEIRAYLTKTIHSRNPGLLKNDLVEEYGPFALEIGKNSGPGIARLPKYCITSLDLKEPRLVESLRVADPDWPRFLVFSGKFVVGAEMPLWKFDEDATVRMNESDTVAPTPP